MTSPSRLAFFRLIATITGLLAAASVYDLLGLAQKLGVEVLASKTWLALLAGMTLLTVFSLLAGIFPAVSRFCLAAFSQRKISPRLRPAAWPALIFLLAAYPLLLAQPALALLRDLPFARLLLFWLMALAGMAALQTIRPATGFFAALGVFITLQTAVNQIAAYLPAITDYPFALGWSETSRFYFPSLFLAQKIYGQAFPWPVLHPSLHLLLTPPYFFDAPLWLHRAWQVAIRFLLVGAIAPALLSRFRVENRLLKFFLAAWVFVYLFSLPLYLHLAPMIFLPLWLYRPGNARRAWLLLIFASIYAGLSRLNWYPMPGILLAALWALESAEEKKGWRTLLFPAALIGVGSITAFLTARVYIAFSGAAQTDFFTSLSSDLLWYRLWPNETYRLGLIPGALIFSAPLWGLLIWGWRGLGRWRAGLALALAALLAGGLLVSLKIGGGADLHNLDAYAALLLILAAYAFFRAEKPLPWQLAALLVAISAWLGCQANSGVFRYDRDAAQSTLTALQQRVDSASGEVLFITQRHLLAMNMIHGVTLVPEYEREDLMEMAMANNTPYLERFARDVENQRFVLIVVDPLKFNLLGISYAMGEENNVWARRVVKPVLCWYQEAAAFPADKIVIYVPRAGGKACP
ncbi:MAG: hypothetical protein CO094_04000 [Anaerolineae bacterium CG_4_9_14_3_um_filter_57_17]|nr:hypothetical protein [bacterium]NCT22010.1 hypothetical protein [bacterium]OIO86223.1 MAG: hypothetical protein AUK01_03910 [Anaerolineae bacterium CG2_30_57_67]PJB67444.1 MAG: hypothetical protein CO094_04000 [Anaerolineae bacterium CG_4_9_14_3_um_filter_57_17]